MGSFRIPGSLGLNTTSGRTLQTRSVMSSAVKRQNPVASPTRSRSSAPPAQHAILLDDDTRTLAATAYGEGSSSNVFEEMAAIANVLVRQQKARGYKSISSFISTDKNFAYAAHDGNERYKQLMEASKSQISADKGMAAALKGAINALSPVPVDYSGGAYFWDGADIKSNYEKHAKVRGGIHFSDDAHNIYGIKEKDVPGEEWWRDKQGKKTKLRGKWTYKYESTAAWGGTIFWKYNQDYLTATGNKEYN